MGGHVDQFQQVGSLAELEYGGAIEAVADDVREDRGGEQAVDHFKVAAA